jgi:hypothetical protein
MAQIYEQSRLAPVVFEERGRVSSSSATALHILEIYATATDLASESHHVYY